MAWGWLSQTLTLKAPKCWDTCIKTMQGDLVAQVSNIIMVTMVTMGFECDLGIATNMNKVTFAS